jgi:competence protein ComEC
MAASSPIAIHPISLKEWWQKRSLPPCPARLLASSLTVLPPLPALVAVALVLVAGTATGTVLAATRVVPAAWEPWFWFGLPGAATLAFAAAVVARLGRPIGSAWRWLLVAVGVSAGAWGWCSGRLFPADDLAWSLNEAPQPVVVIGQVLRGPQRRLMRLDRLGGTHRGPCRRPCSEWLLKVTQARHHDRWQVASGYARVFVDDLPIALPVGAVVQVYGRGLRPTPALNPQEYNFADQARRERVLSLIRTRDWSAVTVQAKPHWWSFRATIDRFRSAAVAQLITSLPEAERPLANALLLGRRQTLSWDDRERFAATGTSHLLAISGLHVGMLVAALVPVLRGLMVPRRVTWLIVAGMVTIYAAVVGDAVPVWRATLLIWAACLAVWLGRRTGGLRSLSLAAMVLLVWRPAASVEVGTQLSFLATAVLLVMAPRLASQATSDPVERLLEQSRPPSIRLVRRWSKRVGNLMLAGLAVWLVAAPLVAESFQRLAPIAIGLNLLLAPVVSCVMASGFCCLLLGGLFPVVGWASGHICGLGLWCLTNMVTAATAVPCGSWRVVSPPRWWLTGWYLLATALLLCWAATCPRLRSGRPACPAARISRQVVPRGGGRPYVLALLAWVVIGLVAVLSPDRPAAGVRVVLAAMGHGCGVVIRTMNGHCLVYDAGRLGAGQAAARSLSAVLASERIHTIDCLTLSHADADHFNAVPELIGRFSVRLVVVSTDFLQSESAMVQRVLAELRQRAIPLRTVKAGDQIDIDSTCVIDVLHPGGGRPGTDNEKSLVLAVEAAGNRLLLTGDLEGAALRRFLDHNPLQCDVLLAPHHGSHTGMPKELAEQLQPKVVLVSGSGGRCWQAVATAFRQHSRSLPCVLRTAGPGPDERGAIAVSLTDSCITVSRFTEVGWRLEAALPTAARGRAAASLLVPTENLGEAACERVGKGGVTGTADCSHQVKGQQPPDQQQHRTADQAGDLPAVEGGGINAESVLRTQHFTALSQAGRTVIEFLTKETRVTRSG